MTFAKMLMGQLLCCLPSLLNRYSDHYKSVDMASMMLNSVNHSANRTVRVEYVGLRPLTVHQNILCVRPNSIKITSRGLTVRAGEIRDNGPIKKLGISDEECEAAVVAGNIPEAPTAPAKPAAPAGTPVVASLVSSHIIRLWILMSIHFN